MHLLGNPRLSEEGRLDHARLVEDVHLHDLHAGSGALEGNLVHRADDGHFLTYVGTCDLHGVGEVEIAVRHVKQQVAHAQNAKALERLGTSA